MTPIVRSAIQEADSIDPCGLSLTRFNISAPGSVTAIRKEIPAAGWLWQDGIPTAGAKLLSGIEGVA